MSLGERLKHLLNAVAEGRQSAALHHKHLSSDDCRLYVTHTPPLVDAIAQVYQLLRQCSW